MELGWGSPPRQWAWGRLAPACIAALVLLIPVWSSARAASSTRTIAGSLQLDYVRPRFSMDCTLRPWGDAYRFFTGRPDHYLGWRLQVRTEPAGSPRAGFGQMLSLGIWQTRYWLNWEVPEYGSSVSPLKARLTGYSVEWGVHAYRRIGGVRISPSVTLPLVLTGFTIEARGTSESGYAIHGGAALGIEAGIGIGGGRELTLGHRRTFLFPREPHYTVEPSVTLHGQFDMGPSEFYLGLTTGGGGRGSGR